jgi:hypothetical protein
MGMNEPTSQMARVALSQGELAEWCSRQNEQAHIAPPSRKVLAIYPEFVCYEEPDGSRTVESAPELVRALDIARFGLSGAKGLDTRLEQARALLDLAEFTAGHEKDKDALLWRLADAFGKPALALLNTPPVAVSISPHRRDALAKARRDTDPPVASHVFSPQEQRKKAECAAQDFVIATRNALRALINWKFPLPDRRSIQPDGVSLVWIAQLTAKQIFRRTLERPTQKQIREAMERAGYGFQGNDVEQRWADLFVAAGLDRIPRS